MASNGPSTSQSSNRFSLKRTFSFGKFRASAFFSSSGEISTAIMWAPDRANISVNIPVPQPISRTRVSEPSRAPVSISLARRVARTRPAGVPQPQISSVSPPARWSPCSISCCARWLIFVSPRLVYNRHNVILLFS